MASDIMCYVDAISDICNVLSVFSDVTMVTSNVGGESNLSDVDVVSSGVSDVLYDFNFFAALRRLTIVSIICNKVAEASEVPAK